MSTELQELTAGAWGTLRISLLVLIIGGITGFILGLWVARTSAPRMVVRFLAVGSSVTPFLAILFWFHYPFQDLLGVVWPPEIVVIALLSVYVSVQTSDVFADELTRTKAGFQDAAVVLGISPSTFLWRIVAPSAVEASLPRFLSIAIATVHMTMFASLIGVEELFRAAQRVNAQALHPVQVYGAMALFYAAICLPLHFAANVWSKRLGKDNPNA